MFSQRSSPTLLERDLQIISSNVQIRGASAQTIQAWFRSENKVRSVSFYLEEIENNWPGNSVTFFRSTADKCYPEILLFLKLVERGLKVIIRSSGNERRMENLGKRTHE